MSVTLPNSASLRHARPGTASGRWKAGWWAGGSVVAVAAGLLLLLIGLARRITGQADEITRALQATHRNTAPLFDLARTNLGLDRMVHQPQEER